MRHADPDFQTLPLEHRGILAGAMVCGTQTSNGLTKLQERLVGALAHSILGVEPDQMPRRPIPPEELAAAAEGLDERVRHRVAQFMVLLELVLDPLPDEVARSVQAYTTALGVSEDLVELGRHYANGAYGLALKDLERKGYFGDFSDHPEVARRMHVHKHLTEPFEVVDHDAELEAEWKALEHCEPGTLGRKIWEFYASRGFVFPGSVGSVSPTLAQHDWVHVLADYGTVIESELEVFAFIAAAIPDPKGFSFLAAIIGVFETGRIRSAAGGVLQADPGHLDMPGMPERLADALRRGRICNRDVMYGVDYFDYVNLPLDEARRQLGIAPKDDEAAEMGSVGVHDPGGITAYQREHGDVRFQPPPS